MCISYAFKYFLLGAGKEVNLTLEVKETYKIQEVSKTYQAQGAFKTYKGHKASPHCYISISDSWAEKTLLLREMPAQPMGAPWMQLFVSLC